MLEFQHYNSLAFFERGLASREVSVSYISDILIPDKLEQHSPYGIVLDIDI